MNTTPKKVRKIFFVGTLEHLNIERQITLKVLNENKEVTIDEFDEVVHQVWNSSMYHSCGPIRSAAEIAKKLFESLDYNVDEVFKKYKSQRAPLWDYRGD